MSNTRGQTRNPGKKDIEEDIIGTSQGRRRIQKATQPVALQVLCKNHGRGQEETSSILWTRLQDTSCKADQPATHLLEK